MTTFSLASLMQLWKRSMICSFPRTSNLGRLSVPGTAGFRLRAAARAARAWARSRWSSLDPRTRRALCCAGPDAGTGDLSSRAAALRGESSWSFSTSPKLSAIARRGRHWESGPVGGVKLQGGPCAVPPAQRRFEFRDIYANTPSLNYSNKDIRNVVTRQNQTLMGRSSRSILLWSAQLSQPLDDVKCGTHANTEQ